MEKPACILHPINTNPPYFAHQVRMNVKLFSATFSSEKEIANQTVHARKRE
jgi:hypothetical protein